MADVPQSTISAIERGDRELNPAVLATVCAVRMPLTFFAFPATQIDPVAVHFRKTAGAGVKARKSALRYFEELKRITGRLMAESRRRPIGCGGHSSRHGNGHRGDRR